MSARALLEHWPVLADRVPLVELAELPTPVESLAPALRLAGCPRDDVFIKRDDLSSPVYGGNKVRTLEVLFGQALARGATHIAATGAFGSNHAAATVLHARRVGLRPGAVLFPQPISLTALANLRVVAAQADWVQGLWHWSALPGSMALAKVRARIAGRRLEIMVPGGATPRGALGYVSAALELAEQIERGELPRPGAILLGVGSNCTTAGLLLGLELCARRGLGFVDSAGRPAPPRLIAVRVTPWPVTSRIRILSLAAAASRHLADLVGDPSLRLTRRELASRLVVDGDELGSGYGQPTDRGRDAITWFRELPELELDTTYSAKAASGFVERARHNETGPLLFWSTKSTAPLPPVSEDQLDGAPLSIRWWMNRAKRQLGVARHDRDGHPGPPASTPRHEEAGC